VNEVELTDTLRDADYRLTASRRRIISVLCSQERGFTAAEVLDALRDAAPDIGRATLFRTLDLLISLGAVERVRLPVGQDGYILCRPPHHHHIVCSSCGTIGEVAADFERALRSAVVESGFTLSDHRLELSGTCARCAPGGEETVS